MPNGYPLNYSHVMLPLAARTEDTTTDEQVNKYCPGFVLFMDVTEVGDPAGSVTLNLQIRDPVTGNWFTIWTAAAPIASVGMRTALFWPSPFTDAAELYTESVDIAVPRDWRIFCDHANDVNSITYSFAVSYIKG